ncbi:MAG: DNA-directed polymerase subunit alpha [Patescibacteria group bacterium]|nr:DNA-directed polymerase subunit alpha [Patescibacteria group bacterium]
MFYIPRLNLKVVSNDGQVGTFEISPLVKGFGQTIGSVLRRTLYSSSQGSVITKVRIDGVAHQFSTIDGVTEDVLHILLNLKKVRFNKTVEGPIELKLDVTGPGKVTAKDIESTSDVQVMNKDLFITELADKKAKLKAYLTVETGYGYVAAPEESTGAIGTVQLDANFSPISNVIVSVEDTRVGRESNFDKLIITVKTDGSVNPEVAIREASKTLKEYFYKLQTGLDYTEQEEAQLVLDNEESVAKAGVSADEVALEELHLATRTINALKKAGIKTLGDLADRSEDDLLRIRNLGEKSIKEIIELLERENLK